MVKGNSCVVNKQNHKPVVKSKFMAKLLNVKKNALLEKSEKWNFDFEREMPYTSVNQAPEVVHVMPSVDGYKESQN